MMDVLATAAAASLQLRELDRHHVEPDETENQSCRLRQWQLPGVSPEDVILFLLNFAKNTYEEFDKDGDTPGLWTALLEHMLTFLDAMGADKERVAGLLRKPERQWARHSGGVENWFSPFVVFILLYFTGFCCNPPVVLLWNLLLIAQL